MKRKAYEPKALLLTSTDLASMRETAFGKTTDLEIFKILDLAERMRDDDALIAAAEAKRARKRARK